MDVRLSTSETGAPDASKRYVKATGPDGSGRWLELVSDRDDVTEADFARERKDKDA